MANPAGQLARVMAGVLRTWRGITLRQWAWTSGIALVLILAYALSILPPMLSITPNLAGPQPPRVTMAKLSGMAISGFAAAYCFLLALSLAERDRAQSRGRAWRYVVAGGAATVAAVMFDNALFLFVPSFRPTTGGWIPETKQVIGYAVLSMANVGLSGGLVLAVYARFQSARCAREAFNSAELERFAASREVLASRLATMQAQVEPQFLLGTLAQVEALYEHDPQAGDRMLDGLIAYLRAALPQLRSAGSTLGRETQLAESYLRIVQLRMGSRLAYAVGIAPDIGETAFPPMMLLPLVDDALRNGLEPLPHGGTIRITADVDASHVRVLIADDGLSRTAGAQPGAGVTLLRERLMGLYGDTARLELTANTPQGSLATIEVPLETARAHR